MAQGTPIECQAGVVCHIQGLRYFHDTTHSSLPLIPRPDSLIVDTSTTSGYAEYNQATYGAGFPLVLDTEPTVVPDQPEQEYTATGGVEIPGVDYTSDTYVNDIIDASEFY